MKYRDYHPVCDCGEYASYNERHDCHFCKACNIWMEANCGDKDCFYCLNRPEFPYSLMRPRQDGESMTEFVDRIWPEFINKYDASFRRMSKLSDELNDSNPNQST